MVVNEVIVVSLKFQLVLVRLVPWHWYIANVNKLKMAVVIEVLVILKEVVSLKLDGCYWS